ncbi:MAG: putative cyclic nucleotide binding protein [Acidimicrobiales bacterium]|nr:putative cyclic nucleotide binding protein [Acidimicrobiales bacterium]
MTGMSGRLAKALSDVREFADGEYIVRDGALGEEMFVIQSGGVRISKRMDGKVVDLGDLGRGQFFGEMSLLESLPRDADARAIGPTKLLVLGPGALLLRIRQDPSFALEMLHQLSARTRRLNDRLAVALEGSSLEVE